MTPITTGADSGRAIGGREPALVRPAFCRYGAPGALGPVVISIPHAGREYPVDLVAEARHGLAALRALEDRHVDALAHDAIAAGHCALVARRGRAEIDLNRHEDEIDAASVADIPRHAPMRTGPKLRGGLGLIPRHYHAGGELWRRRPDYAEVRRRVEAIHAPYHAELAAMIAATVARHGVAVLIDLHSMPSLRAPPGGVLPPRIVIGDRFGQSAGPAWRAMAAGHLGSFGEPVAVNSPYAGGYTLERHGRPEGLVHALQVEFDRVLYLDAMMDAPGPDAARWGGVVAGLAERLCAAPDEGLSLAAE